MSGDQSAIAKLLSISSEALAPEPGAAPKMFAAYTLGPELFGMLQRRNGFYAFESALHVFPIASDPHMSMEEWNAATLWRDRYHDLANGLLFFAEDIFQDQFCLSTVGVMRFDSETGRCTVLGDSIEAWASVMLSRHGKEVGWRFAHEWQTKNGPLATGQRLMPNIPFFLGGEYMLENFLSGEGSRACASKVT